MTTVWITRTEPGASALAGALTALGLEAITAPVLEIEATGAERPAGDFDLHVFLSVHAATLSVCAAWRPTPAIAVGAATGSRLRELGVQVSVPRHASSEGLLELIRSDFADARSILLVAGEEGRADLATWLQDDGRTVTTWPVYRRTVANPRVDLTTVDVVVVGSVDGLRRFAELWAVRTDGPGLDVPLLVPSQRVADIARNIGFTTVITSRGATPDAVVAAIECEGL